MRIASLVALLLAACAPVAGPAAPSPSGTPDPVACKAEGGAIRPVCKLQRPTCVIAYKDAGTACSDSSQCDGRCVTDRSTGSPGQVAGVCEADSDPCGCVTEVVGGVARTICVD